MVEKTGGLLYLYALSTLHPGVGRGGEYVDLPVQRDEFGYPVIWGSSLKGSLRSYFTINFKDHVKHCFGAEPASDEVSEYPSSVTIHDARLLLLPARSLKGVWLYTTSPHTLSYLELAAEAINIIICGEEVKKITAILDAVKKLKERAPSTGSVLLSDSRYLVNGDKVFINENVYSAMQDNELSTLVRNILPDDFHNLIQGVALVNNDDMVHILRKSLLIQYRVRLSRERKTVERGALWSEEHIPQRSLFISCIICKPSLYKESRSDLKSAKGVYNFIKNAHFINLGGKESIGHGLVKLRWLP
jgi:CRISPR-associated protein Cmr4